MPITTTPLWQWDLTSSVPVATGYPGKGGVFNPTKTGLTPQDLQNFVGVPLAYYGNPPVPVSPTVLLQWLRWAEDRVEQKTNILLCQTWVAGPPEQSIAACNAAGIIPANLANGQQQGYDYDLEDNAYDFFYPRARDEGWMYYSLRYRPIRSLSYTNVDNTAVKNIAYIYPLLNEYFHVPTNWLVEDRDFGLIRLVPATDVQMLPLFALQLAFMGFAESVPGGIHFQYTSGLTPNDYNSRFSFMQELVLAEAALTALSAIQGTINLGAESVQTTVDGLQYRVAYGKDGAFGNLLTQFEKRRAYLMEIARTKVTPIPIGSL